MWALESTDQTSEGLAAARRLFLSGRRAEALESLRFERLDRARVILEAQILYWHRDRARAVEFVDNAFRHLQLDPGDREVCTARCVRAAALASLGRPQARSEFADISKQQNLTPVALFYLALAAYALKDYPFAHSLLDRIETANANLNAYASLLLGWLAAARAEIGSQIDHCIRALAFLGSAETPDLNARAMTLRVLATLARDRLDQRAFANVLDYDASWWTDDLAVEHFQVERMMGWYRVMNGEFILAGEHLANARRLASKPLLSMLAHLDRAWLATISRERVHAALELREAETYRNEIPLEDASDDEVGALLLAAELTSKYDPSRARDMLCRARAANVLQSHGYAHDDRLKAFDHSAAAAVSLALGDTRAAHSHLCDALVIYERFDYRWRAANAAMELFRITHAPSWLEHVAPVAKIYPRSFVAAEFGRILDGNDPMDSLTERQRQIVRLIETEGLNNDGIAARLGMSPNTVRIHKQRIYRAFRVSSEFQLLSKLHNAAS